jgi:hypothetical protein
MSTLAEISKESVCGRSESAKLLTCLESPLVSRSRRHVWQTGALKSRTSGSKTSDQWSSTYFAIARDQSAIAGELGVSGRLERHREARPATSGNALPSGDSGWGSRSGQTGF